MADAASDLRVLVAGSDGKASIADKTGKVHHLAALDLYDMVELERRMGGTILDENKILKLADIVYVLYLSLRKEGCTEDQLAKGQYGLSEKQVLMMFDLKFLNKSADLFTDLLKISGVEVPPVPTPEPAEKDPASPA